MPQLRDSAAEATDDNRHSDDFSRIFGVETEYGISVTQTAARYDPSAAAMAMFAPVVSKRRSTNTYLSNGARLYLDVGSHPEYAAAEALTPSDAMIQDAAGEAVMARLALKAQEELADKLGQPDLKLHVYKNNLDTAGNSFGCHENYLLRRFVPLSEVERFLIPFLATRLVWAGAGQVRSGAPDRSAAGFGYEIAQRADVLDEAVSSSTTRVRPMVNTRDEPHANPDQFRRLHVIVGDSNRSQTSTWLRLASTHLVLCMMEQAHRAASADDGNELSDQMSAMLRALPDQLVENPTEFMKRVSRGEADSLRQAFDVQRLYCDAAALFARAYRQELVAAESIGAAELDDVLSTWDEAVTGGEHAFAQLQNGRQTSPDDDFETGEEEHTDGSDALQTMNPADTVSSEFSAESGISLLTYVGSNLPQWVEWACKLELLQAERRRRASVATLHQIELAYHDVANGRIFQTLVAQGRMPQRVSQKEQSRAVSEPPMGTRALLRGEFVRQASASAYEWTCDWTHLEVNDAAARHEAVILDPFAVVPSRAVQAVFDVFKAVAQ